MKTKKLCSFLFIFLILALTSLSLQGGLYAFALDGQITENYVVYNEEGEIVCEKSTVELGDIFITKDFEQYEIVEVENHKAQAKLVKKLEPPKIYRQEDVAKDKFSSRGNLSKKICLYMTHNDESYTPSDGYDSVYGAGGIHDVARAFKRELSKKDIDIVLDETLHIPHNSSAYTRSSVTAKKLLEEERPDAMFDVHRDGVSKSYYYVTNGGEGYSKIRIVVGKSNPNFDENFGFAQTVFALGNEKYPFLFSDIYLGKGHYNQALQPTDLLFEMGTYLIEKEYVYNSLPLLADIVNTALYSSMVDEEGDIIVDEKVENPANSAQIVSPGNKDNVKPEEVSKSSKGWIAPMVLSISIVVIMIIAGIILYRKSKKNEKR